MNYEGSTASGARSGRTGATGVMDQGTGTGTGTGSGVGTGRSATTGTGNTGSRSTGATTGGVSEGFRGLNLTGSSGVCSFSLLLDPFHCYMHIADDNDLCAALLPMGLMLMLVLYICC